MSNIDKLVIPHRHAVLYEQGKCLWCFKDGAEDEYISLYEVWTNAGDDSEKLIGTKRNLRFCNRRCMTNYFMEP